MKKIIRNKKLLKGVIIGVVIVLLVFIIFLFNGRKMVCTMTSDQSLSGYQLDTKYVIKYKGKYVTKVDITEIISSKDNEKLLTFEKNFNDQYSYNKKTYGGYTYKVTNKNGKVTSKVTINYKVFNIEKFIENNEAMKDYVKNNKMTISGAREMYESTGATCK